MLLEGVVYTVPVVKIAASGAEWAKFAVRDKIGNLWNVVIFGKLAKRLAGEITGEDIGGATKILLHGKEEPDDKSGDKKFKAYGALFPQRSQTAAEKQFIYAGGTEGTKKTWEDFKAVKASQGYVEVDLPNNQYAFFRKQDCVMTGGKWLRKSDWVCNILGSQFVCQTLKEKSLLVIPINKSNPGSTINFGFAKKVKETMNELLRMAREKAEVKPDFYAYD